MYLWGVNMSQNWKEKVKTVTLEEVEERSENLFRSCGYNCAESMLQTASETLGIPVDLRYVTGFGGGLGETRCVCGAFNGGVVALNLLLGEDKQKLGARGGGRNEENAALLDLAIQEFSKRFKSQYKVNCCKVLTRTITWGTPEHLEHCVQLTGETAKMLLQVVQNLDALKEQDSAEEEKGAN